jgi:hypothetical protein
MMKRGIYTLHCTESKRIDAVSTDQLWFWRSIYGIGVKNIRISTVGIDADAIA